MPIQGAKIFQRGKRTELSIAGVQNRDSLELGIEWLACFEIVYVIAILA